MFTDDGRVEDPVGSRPHVGSSVAVSFRGPTPRVLIADLARGGQAITALTYFGE